MTLQQFFAEHRRVALGFSGGVDSAYLLYAALQYGADVQPYYIKTAFQPQFELDDALRLAKMLGASVTVLTADILASEQIAANSPQRCYDCKRAMFSLLRKQALSDGYSVLIDGTNASDDVANRPGMRALQELAVRSPLRECGLSKPEIRRLSREAGLFTWDKPAYACLATRVPTGQVITAELLRQVEAAENDLLALGLRDFRVRVYHEAARLQVQRMQLTQVYEQWTEIHRLLQQYFPIVVLDMEMR